VQHFLDHLAEVLAREAQALVEVGIDIVQLDDPALTYFCDRRLTEGTASDIHDERLRRTWEVDRQFPRFGPALAQNFSLCCSCDVAWVRMPE